MDATKPAERAGSEFPRRVFLLARRTLLWLTLERVIEQMDDVVIVGRATTLQEGARCVAAMEPDAIFLAADSDSEATSYTAGELKAADPQTKIIVVGEKKSPECVGGLVERGIEGYLTWECTSPSALRLCLEATVDAGLFAASPPVVRQLVVLHG